MRALSRNEARYVAGGHVPTAQQLSHLYYAPNRRLANDVDRLMYDTVAKGMGLIGADIGMTTEDRERELSSMFQPNTVSVINGVGYSNDGTTTLYDDDDDGIWDSALQHGDDGYVWVYEMNGWEHF
ncbi:MAG: hypothetical protein EON89_04875 [Brevundimonas sp.]|nr:MAG: hypothetical protein EON89_04875 [Brevundimonas sp.]